MRGTGINYVYSGDCMRLKSEHRGNPGGRWIASRAGSVCPTLMSARTHIRPKRPPRTGLETIGRKNSQALCCQRPSVEGNREGGYPSTKEPPGLTRTDGK